MYSKRLITLGQYDFRQGGSIIIPMGPNMEFGTEISTKIHEMYHANLMDWTNLGFAIQILEIERVLAEEKKDDTQSKRIKNYIEILAGKISNIQEIYANNMEMLWIIDLVGIEEGKKCYNAKPINYKKYCDYMNDITQDDNLSIYEKKKWIDDLCKYAMNIHISSEDFISSLESDKKLIKYFDSDNHPEKRLNKEIELYKNGIYVELKDSIDLDIIGFVKKIKDCGVVKYLADFVPELSEVYENILNSNAISKKDMETMYKNYYENLEESIKAFDFSTIKVQREISFNGQKPVTFFIIKNCMNLDNQEENYYLIGHSVKDDTPIYFSTEVTKLELNNFIDESECIVTHFNEYNIEKSCPKYFETKAKPLIVLIDDYKQCYNWFKDEYKKHEIYVGNLYDDTVNNFYTVLFFSKRNEPNTIYIFPTMKKLANRFIKDFELNDTVIYTNQAEFLKIISCLDNEATMLKVLQWLLSFLTDSKGEFSSLNDSATKMNYDLTRTLLNEVFKDKVKNYYRFLATLPTKKTLGKPFYALMQFDGNSNTGLIKAVTEDKLPIFFFNTDEAIKWRNEAIKTDSETKSYEVVGIDICYWNTLREYLSKNNGRICVCINSEKHVGKVVELNEIDEVFKYANIKK